MIRDRNLDPNIDAAKHPLVLNFTGAASLAGVEVAAGVVPMTGKITSAVLRACTLTDADDSARVDLHKNGVTILSATVDPVAAATTTTLSISTTNAAVVSGDVISVVLTTGVGDAIVGSVTVTVRAYTGAAERFAAKAAGISITP